MFVKKKKVTEHILGIGISNLLGKIIKSCVKAQDIGYLLGLILNSFISVFLSIFPSI